ncbi:hypothetical protein CEXT_801471 [Caerostris extrusa]|uniref:Uncharacterized protein n=1 Tax=Caerostris extrusa TaxID=172846 RepID=A0AAV4UYT1_CAEEX|nr:hypothetical protein CEXT_801471 [Caerostris extrusa]
MNSNDQSFKTHKVSAPPGNRFKCRLEGGLGWKGSPWKILEEPNNLFAHVLLMMATHWLGINSPMPSKKSTDLNAPPSGGLTEEERSGVDNSVKSIDQGPRVVCENSLFDSNRHVIRN